MCLVTFQKKAKITKKDLVVYKSIQLLQDGTFNSIYNGFNWEKGILYKTNLGIYERIAGKTIVYDSIAAEIYNTNCKVENRIANEISEGFHACLTKERVNENFDKYPCREFIIPKGSEVFYDKTGLIVSNQMKRLD